MAGFSQSGADDEVISGINVTPLVDVVLVLLVIFMMTAPVIYQSAIKVQLPKAKTGDAAQNQDKKPLSFTLTTEGELTWADEKVSWDALPGRLSALGQDLSNQNALIQADEKTPHGTVVKLMDILRAAGLTQFGLSVDGSEARR